MPRKLFQASVHVPDYPRVRFFAPATQNGKQFEDVTERVCSLVLQELDDDKEGCELIRLDAQAKLVWATRHPSIQEAKWHVEFEYGLPEEKWTPCSE